jgi:hypothetical protein
MPGEFLPIDGMPDSSSSRLTKQEGPRWQPGAPIGLLTRAIPCTEQDLSDGLCPILRNSEGSRHRGKPAFLVALCKSL